MEFPDQQELIAMKAVMDGEDIFNKADLKSGMQKIEAKTLYDLIKWGLIAGIIRDSPMTEIKDYAMTDPKKFYESYPSWLKLLDGLVAGYNPQQMEIVMGLGKDSQEFYHRKIAIEFHLHPSKARLIRFAFQVCNPVTPPPASKIDWRPWTGSRTSLMRIPQTNTGSTIDQDAVVTNETPVRVALRLLGVENLPKSKRKGNSIWIRDESELLDILYKAKERRDEEIKRLGPMANRHSDDPIEQQRAKMADRQLAVVNSAWARIRGLFARNKVALYGDEEAITKYARHLPREKPHVKKPRPKTYVKKNSQKY